MAHTVFAWRRPGETAWRRIVSADDVPSPPELLEWLEWRVGVSEYAIQTRAEGGGLPSFTAAGVVRPLVSYSPHDAPRPLVDLS